MKVNHRFLSRGGDPSNNTIDVGFHTTRACTKGKRCGRCAGAHETTECTAKVPKCSKYAGPHESSSHNCMARPRWHDGLAILRTPVELRVIRWHGYRKFKTAHGELANKSKDVEIITSPEATMQEE